MMGEWTKEKKILVDEVALYQFVTFGTDRHVNDSAVFMGCGSPPQSFVVAATITAKEVLWTTRQFKLVTFVSELDCAGFLGGDIKISFIALFHFDLVFASRCLSIQITTRIENVPMYDLHYKLYINICQVI